MGIAKIAFDPPPFDKDKYKDKDTEKVPETPNLCYIFEILMTHSFQI